jgi:SAM-dependent methyltransferase
VKANVSVDRLVNSSDLRLTAQRGNPSYVWRAGQERRLALVRRSVPLENARILDAGCGIGAYLRRFSELSNQAFGIDIEEPRLHKAKDITGRLAVARGEALPFVNDSFTMVFSHEVLEHVDDDLQAMAELVRVTKPGGYLVLFVPNRWFPFETHGFYLRNRYVFGNIPAINYLPNPIRNRLCPHVRAYTSRGLRKLWSALPVRVAIHQHLYPGFDNVAARRPWLSRFLRRVLYFGEKTPLEHFGLSHFVVLQKLPAAVIDRTSTFGLFQG